MNNLSTTVKWYRSMVYTSVMSSHTVLKNKMFFECSIVSNYNIGGTVFLISQCTSRHQFVCIQFDCFGSHDILFKLFFQQFPGRGTVT